MAKVAPFRAPRSAKRRHYALAQLPQAQGFVPLLLISSVAMFLAVWFYDPAAASRAGLSSMSGPDRQFQAQFGFCHVGGGYNCVVDGDTFYVKGAKVRVASIDAPETHPPRCAREAELGAKATQRLQALLSAGPFTLSTIERDRDIYGRQLRIPYRDGESLADTLVGEGLARPYAGGRRPWC